MPQNLTGEIISMKKEESYVEMTDEQLEAICYKSKLLNRYFDDYAELVKAEDEYSKAHAEEIAKAETRKRRAKEVEEAHKKSLEVRSKCAAEIRESDKYYIELRNAFVKDYGSYHETFSQQYVSNWESLFEDILNFNFFR